MRLLNWILSFFDPDSDLKKKYKEENKFWNGNLPFEVYCFYYRLNFVFKSSGNPFSVHQITDRDLRRVTPGHSSSSMNIWISSEEDLISLMYKISDRLVCKSSVSFLVNGQIVIFGKSSKGESRILFSNRMKMDGFVVSNRNNIHKKLGESHAV